MTARRLMTHLSAAAEMTAKMRMLRWLANMNMNTMTSTSMNMTRSMTMNMLMSAEEDSSRR